MRSLLTLAVLVLVQAVLAPSARASCTPRQAIQFHDGSTSCIDDYPFGERRAHGQISSVSRTFRQYSNVTMALPREPAQCARAMGFDLGSPGFLVPQMSDRDRMAAAVGRCQKDAGQALAACTCEVVVMDGRALLPRAVFDARLRDAMRAGDESGEPVAAASSATQDTPLKTTPAAAPAPPAATAALPANGVGAPAPSSGEMAAIREQILRMQAELDKRQPAPAAPATARMRSRALVIGNSRYAHLGVLPNAANDARAIADKLRGFGIEVDLVLDADRARLVRALAEYQGAATGRGLNILFYAGHGLQLDGVNYIVPVELGAEAATAGSVKLNAVSLNDAIEYLPARTRIVFLDACRDNPLSRSLRISRSSAGLGLAPVHASSGTLVAYATKDGATAEDGRGRHSPYTEALLTHLDAQEDIAIVLRRVRQAVLSATGQRQEPWEYGSLVGDALVLSLVAR